MNPAKTHILVVDDEDELRELFREHLEKAGYACDTASSGKRALEVLTAKPIDLVLVDIMMPRMSGLTLFERIREDSLDVAVIFVSAMDDVEIAVGNVKHGAYDYLVKPVTLRRLREAVEEALDRRRSVLDGAHDDVARSAKPELPAKGTESALDRQSASEKPGYPPGKPAALDGPAKVCAHTVARNHWETVEKIGAKAEDACGPRDGDGVFEGISERSNSGVYEGDVTLIVEAGRSDHRAAAFVNALRQDPRVRLFAADFTHNDGVLIALSLRRPVRLEEMLARKGGISDVSVIRRDEAAEADGGPLI